MKNCSLPSGELGTADVYNGRQCGLSGRPGAMRGGLTLLGVDEGEGALEGLLDLGLADLALDLGLLLELLLLLGCGRR